MSKSDPIACPQCQKVTATPHLPGRETCVCGLCYAVLEMRGEGPVWAQQHSEAARSNIPLPLGTEGELGGIRFRVVGWVRYQGSGGGETWQWEEWRLYSDDGQERWISHASEEGFFVLRKAYQQRQASSSVGLEAPSELREAQSRLNETTHGTVIAMAGSFKDALRLGQRVQYSSGVVGGELFSFEFDGESLEVFRGAHASQGEIGKAFGISGIRLKMLWNALTPPNVDIAPDKRGFLSISEGAEGEGGLSVASGEGGELSTVEE